jgi:Ankyrin repeats (3 copies)
MDTSIILSDATFLQQIFSFLPGNRLFLGGVCRAWMLSYRQMPACDVLARPPLRKTITEVTLEWPVTLMTAACESRARFRWAFQSGLGVTGNITYIAGLCADVPTLLLAAQAGMSLTETIEGPVCSGRVSVVDFLLQQQHRKRRDVDALGCAAQCGNVDMLKCLEKHRYKLTTSSCSKAASAGQLAALQYILSTLHCTCELADDAGADGSENDSDSDTAPCELCDWVQNSCMERAVESGQVEIVQWLQQHYGIGPDHAESEHVIAIAASAGHTAMCEYLRSQQCAWSYYACEHAASEGHIDTLRWLFEHGCPVDAERVCTAAAKGGSIAILEYLQQQGLLSTAAQLTETLQSARKSHQMDAAKWLQQQGAPWPTVLTDCTAASAKKETSSLSGRELKAAHPL